jgi:hypothetical protein
MNAALWALVNGHRLSLHNDETRILNPVAQALDAFAFGAVVAAERSILLQAMADDADAAVLPGRRQRVDRAFNAVERVRLAVHRDLKGFRKTASSCGRSVRK